MKTTLRAGAELDLLTADELRSALGELATQFAARPPRRLRVPSGVVLDSSGNGDVKAYRVETGYRLELTRLEVSVDGYTSAVPYNPGTAGGVDIFVDGQWRDGIPFGGGTGYVLPVVYTESADKSIVAQDDALVVVRITGGPPSVGVTVALCGPLSPIPPILG